MKTKGLLARTAVGAVGAMMLTGMAGVAIADELQADDVDVNVEIEALPPVGALTMTVAADFAAISLFETCICAMSFSAAAPAAFTCATNAGSCAMPTSCRCSSSQVSCWSPG